MAEPHSMKTPWIATPLIHSLALSRAAGCQIYLKLENLQPAGSFKSRGIGNLILTHLRAASASSTTTQPHFYIASGGNAGLACVHAAVTLSTAATVVVPLTTSEYMIEKIRTAGAVKVIHHGLSWAEADAYLKKDMLPAARARGENAVYVPPFDAPEIWAGHSTLVREVFDYFQREAPQHRICGKDSSFDAIVCSVGGGGLFCGVMQGLNDCGIPDTPVLAIETIGADSLSQSLKSGQLVTLPAITSIASTLGAKTVAPKAFEDAKQSNVTSVVLEDREAVFGCLKLADEERLIVEPSCGVSIAVCYKGRLEKLVKGLNEESKIVIIVCGGSDVTIDRLEQWRSVYL